MPQFATNIIKQMTHISSSNFQIVMIPDDVMAQKCCVGAGDQLAFL